MCTLGIGQDANRNILTDIAQVTHGVCRMIADSAKIDEVVIELLGYCFSEYATNICINGQKLADYAYPGDSISLFGKTSEPITCIKYDYMGQQVVLPVVATEIYSDDGSNNFVSQLYYNNQIEKKLVQNPAELSKTYSILTQYASFILYKDDEIVEKPNEVEYVNRGVISFSAPRAVIVDGLIEQCIVSDQCGVYTVSNQSATRYTMSDSSRTISGSTQCARFSHQSKRSSGWFGSFGSSGASVSSGGGIEREQSRSPSSPGILQSFSNWFQNLGSSSNGQTREHRGKVDRIVDNTEDVGSVIDEFKSNIKLLDYKLADGSFEYSEKILLLKEINMSLDEFNKYMNDNHYTKKEAINMIIYEKIKDITKYKFIIENLRVWIEKYITLH